MKNTAVKLLLVFPVLLAYIFFTGCSKKPAKAEENTQIQISSTPQQDFDLGGYTVRIAQWWDAKNIIAKLNI